MLTGRIIRVGFAIAALGVSSADAAIRYAKTTVWGNGSCNSWVNACTLPTALAASQSGDEIWVAQGTHAPLILKNGVKIIGGFLGSESAANLSNPATRITIIDGGGTARCVSGSGDAPNTILRGFHIKNGKAADDEGGGGILLQDSSALVVQCTFENNTASDFGGAVVVRGTGSPQFINCIFRNNGEVGATIPHGGGAVFVYRGSPQFVNCLFHDNKAQEGGAVLVAFGSPTFINCTFADNDSTVSYGGGVSDPEAKASFKNCVLWNNTSAKDPTRTNQVFNGAAGFSDAISSNVQGGWPGSGNINADPLFVSPGSGDYSLQQLSPCKHAGLNAALPQSDPADLDWDGNPDEVLPKDLASTFRTIGVSVDMGAYEVPPPPPPGGGGGGDP